MITEKIVVKVVEEKDALLFKNIPRDLYEEFLSGISHFIAEQVDATERKIRVTFRKDGLLKLKIKFESNWKLTERGGAVVFVGDNKLENREKVLQFLKHKFGDRILIV